MILGIETDTQDIWGNIIDDCRDKIKNIDKQRILDEFNNNVGEILQKPPDVSAVRINGKRLYEYKRDGEYVDVKLRPVIVRSLEVIEINLNNGRILFDIICSKGTYIRSICHDVGKALGCGGSMSFLSRSENGAYKLEDTVSLEEVEKDWEFHLLPLDYPLKKFGQINIKSDRVAWFTNGGYLRTDEVEVIKMPTYKENDFLTIKKKGLDRAFNVYCKDQFLGVVLFEKEENRYLTDKVFYG